MEDIARESGTEIHVKLAAVRPTPTPAARGDTTVPLSFEHYARILSDHGMIERIEPFLPTLSPCGMTRLNELHIEADGTIYPNCHNAPYVSDLALGNVLDGKPID